MSMLAYEVAGEGTPIVLLHAFPLSHAMWKDQVAPLAKVGRVIAPDLPGFGRSARQPEPSIAEMASSVIGILDALGIQEPAVVGGLSMGGYVALEMWRQRPERIRALGLFSTRAGADTIDQRQARAHLAQTIRTEGLEPLTHTLLPKLLGKTSLTMLPMVMEQVSWLIMANKPDGVADALLAMGQRSDLTSLLPSIQVATLLLAGNEDAVIDPAESEAMQRAIPGATLVRINGSGHLLNLEQPSAFLTAFGSFLSKQAGI
jgi:pimeloyl-ACP methyl ester carboxylesterase